MSLNGILEFFYEIMPIIACESEKHQCRSAPYKLSICIPTWNRADLLEKQLDNIASAQQGHCHDFEVVVIDNASSDNTWERIKNEAKSNRLFLKSLRNPVNVGIDLNFLRAFEHATGEWTWIIGDDDHQINMDTSISTICGLNDLPAALTILLDMSETDWAGLEKKQVSYLNFDQFMSPKHDGLGSHLHQVSKVVCRTHHVTTGLKRAYSRAIGNLHAHSYIYAPILQDTGLNIIAMDGFFSEWPAWYLSVPRWNLLHGHIGAWRSSVDMFSSLQSEARERERRIRGKDILGFMTQLIDNGQQLTSSDWQFAKEQLGNKAYYKLRLKQVLRTFKETTNQSGQTESALADESGY
ncbi:glycosyltransferase family 2 protein [Cyanobium sp. Cruz-8D1]|uniref:glycosyltransferase family 2 protein n=1 Tax=Cyanobium sp. Cruz-8D1 TaxID=2823711 RepID=UPI0020CB9C99|nr:glycosyltransferase family 2 protein [Cyanobium sp. Cruz-8D1]